MKANQKVVTIAIVLVLVIAVIFGVYYFFLRDKNSNSGVKLVEMALPDNTHNINGNIDEAKIETSAFKDFLMIRGWAFKQNVKEKSREMYLVLKSKSGTLVYDLLNDNQPRRDVTDYYKLAGGVDNHGFTGYIPLKELKDPAYKIGFIIKDETGQYFTMLGKEISFSNGSVKIENAKIKDNSVSIPLQPSTDKINYYFEKFDFSGNVLNVKGWAYLDGRNADSLKTYIVLRNTKTTTVFSVVAEQRNDVTRYFKKSGLNLDNSGFSCRIEGEELDNGKYEVCLYLVSRREAGLISSHKFVDITK